MALALAPPPRRVARVVVEALRDEDQVGDAEVAADRDGGWRDGCEEGTCGRCEPLVRWASKKEGWAEEVGIGACAAQDGYCALASYQTYRGLKRGGDA